MVWTFLQEKIIAPGQVCAGRLIIFTGSTTVRCCCCLWTRNGYMKSSQLHEGERSQLSISSEERRCSYYAVAGIPREAPRHPLPSASEGKELQGRGARGALLFSPAEPHPLRGWDSTRPLLLLLPVGPAGESFGAGGGSRGFVRGGRLRSDRAPSGRGLGGVPGLKEAQAGRRARRASRRLATGSQGSEAGRSASPGPSHWSPPRSRRGRIGTTRLNAFRGQDDAGE